MLQKDPENRPNISLLLKEPKVIEAIENLFEILNGQMAIEVFEKSVQVKKIININTKLFEGSRCANKKEI